MVVGVVSVVVVVVVVVVVDDGIILGFYCIDPARSLERIFLYILKLQNLNEGMPSPSPSLLKLQGLRFVFRIFVSGFWIQGLGLRVRGLRHRVRYTEKNEQSLSVSEKEETARLHSGGGMQPVRNTRR